VTCWAVVALAGLLLLARAVHRQRRALALRALVTNVASIEALERLSRRAGLRPGITLSRCAQASSPLVFSSREICLPERAACLDAAALEAVLAHEIAHIERRDGLWLYAALVLQALLWFQPLNRRVRAELQETAELAADARAVDLTGDALGLARTLTLVASWVSSAEPAPFVAMARAGSLIVERVVRLVEASDARSASRRSARTPWLALAALTAIGACSPSVGAPEAPEHAADANGADDTASIDNAEVGGKRVEAPGLLGRQQQPRSAASPSDGPVNDAVASVLPNAVALGQSVANLAMAEHTLQESILRVEQRLAAQGVASGTAQPDLESLRCQLAETTANRLRLTVEFEARMRAWDEAFEREQRPRLAAWDKDFGRRMDATGRDLERSLGQLRSLSVPPPPVVPSAPLLPSAP